MYVQYVVMMHNRCLLRDNYFFSHFGDRIVISYNLIIKDEVWVDVMAYVWT
jgi:hypothetical protein